MRRKPGCHAREPGLALVRAVLAHRSGDYDGACDALMAVRPEIRRLGGSHAQRDLFEETLIDAGIRAGRTETASALFSERIGRRPRNAWSRRHYAQVLEQLGNQRTKLP
jgi:predicted Zn-dependent protease